MAYESGKLGKVTVGVTDINITGWTLDFEAEALETTNTNTAGFYSSIMGIESARGTFTANWDSAAQATDNPPDLTPGTTPAKVRLYIGDPAGANFFDCTSVMILGCSVSSTVRGLVSYTCNFECTGAWVYPT